MTNFIKYGIIPADGVDGKNFSIEKALDKSLKIWYNPTDPWGHPTESGSADGRHEKKIELVNSIPH